jgi:phosphoglycerate dehydrogenase-like enzyme
MSHEADRRTSREAEPQSSSESTAGAARVVLLDDYQQVALASGPWQRLAGRTEVDVIGHHITDRDELVRRLRPATVVVAMRERTAIDEALLAELPNLRLLVTTGMGNQAIDLAACADRGVVVCGTGGMPHGTAELTWALILAAARHLPTELANVRGGGWMTTVGTDLAGARLGVIGLGRLGSQVARIGLAFGMDVVAYSQHLTRERCDEVGVALCTLPELLGTSDFVSIHLVLSERTRGLLGAPELALMRPTAWLVNTSRGPICDETALAEVCRARGIAGACLDAFATEPLPPGQPFRTLDNVIATPHIGYVTERTYRVFFDEIVADIEGWLDGQPVRVITP